MARLPFNPDRVPEPAPEPRPTAAGDRPMTVTEVSALIKQTLADALPARLRIVGEVSNFNERTHWFFSIKDDGATLRCVCFASSARRAGFTPTDGTQVVATGRLDYYDAQGSLQLYVEKLEPVGQGALEAKFRALCNELRGLGYFDDERKKPLPAMPCRIAVITSRSGAALQDVINTAGKRWGGCGLLLLDVRVQGAAAAPEIARAIEAVSRHGQRLGIDAVILTRGGGSIEDLWAFNERVVADALVRCPIPVVAAIGHETDTTIAELVADVRCSTPTQAAMQLVPDRAALLHQVTQTESRLGLVARRAVQHQRQHLESLARHPMLRRPMGALAPVRQRLGHLEARLRETGARAVAAQRQRLEHLAGQPVLRRPLSFIESTRTRLDGLARHLESVGPENVLGRGYSYTLDAAGQLVRKPSQVGPGQTITTVLAEGRITSRVEGEPMPTPTAAPRKRPRRKRGDGTDPTLFAV